MISKEKFNFIKNKYGHCSSWAIWAEVGDKPKSNVGDLTIFENEAILEILNPDIIFVGLNISRNDIKQPLANFHSNKSKAQEFKLRFAIKDTLLWGAYMTDIIKDYDELDSKNVINHLKENKNLEEKSVKTFQQEIIDLESNEPMIIALGNATYKIMLKNFPHLNIIKLTHFSHRIAKEKYREEVKSIYASINF